MSLFLMPEKVIHSRENLEELLLVNIDDQDPDADVPFSLDDAEALVSNSGDFDQWLNENVFDLQNFRSKRKGGDVEAA